MGLIADWLEDKIHREYGGRRSWAFPLLAGAARVWSWFRPYRLDPRRTIVLASFEPPAAQLIAALGDLPAWVAMPNHPRQPLQGVRYARWCRGTNPLLWNAELDACIPGEVDTVVTFQNWNEIFGQTLRHWWKRGIRRCWFLREGPRVGVAPFAAAVFKLLQHPLRSDGLRVRWVKRRECKRFLARIGQPTPPSQPRGIAHYIGSLGSGGAERQLCNTAIRQHQAGLPVRVILSEPSDGPSGYYLPLLQAAGVPVQVAGSSLPDNFSAAWARHNLPQEAFLLLHQDFRPPVLDLLGELLLQPPELLHCWLDYTNVAGLVAAQLCGVPRVVMSLRSVNPEQTPRLLTPWLQSWYGVGAELPGVKLVANSAAGARDYERWLGLQSGHIEVLHNAFAPPPTPEPVEIDAFRRGQGLSASTPVIAGVFRLAPEKRPLLFLSIVKKIHAQIPNLQVLLAGCGPLESEVKEEIAKLGLQRVVHLLGVRRDVPVILSASKVLLLVSNAEGTPNVALEAQHFGCVPVLTDAGGSAESIRGGETGLLYAMDDLDGLADGVVRLLRDEETRASLARAGRAFVAQRFKPDTIHARTLALYETLGYGAEPALRRVA